MPTASYEQLLIETAPQVIETDEQYEQIVRRADELVGKADIRTAQETKLMRLLLLLVRDYDQRNAMPPDDSTPAEMLQFLVEHSGQSASVLLRPIFGQRSRVHEALTGKRPITGVQAKKLGELFRVNPGLFL